MTLAVTLIVASPQASDVRAAEALVAVAANFKAIAERLAADFEHRQDHELRLASGSTGQLYAQIINGAPFDLLLAADQQRPELLLNGGGAVAGSRFTYAVGKLVLWSAERRPAAPSSAVEVLRAGEFRKLALAQPELAPYGAAALEVLRALALLPDLAERLVFAHNVAQAYSMVATGNAQLGLVAASHVASAEHRGQSWVLPSSLYTPIRQDAVLLEHGRDNEAARAFLDYLKSTPARQLIHASGYEPP